MRRDRWQNMITAQHDASFWVKQTEVIFGVPGRVNGHPLAPCE